MRRFKRDKESIRKLSFEIENPLDDHDSIGDEGKVITAVAATYRSPKKASLNELS